MVFSDVRNSVMVILKKASYLSSDVNVFAHWLTVNCLMIFNFIWRSNIVEVLYLQKFVDT